MKWCKCFILLYYGPWMCQWQKPARNIHLLSVATLQPSVVLWSSSAKFGGGQGRLKSVTEGKLRANGEGLGSGPLCAHTLNCDCTTIISTEGASADSFLSQDHRSWWQCKNKQFSLNVWIMFWYSYLHERYWWFQCTQTGKADTKLLLLKLLIAQCWTFKS